jgi:flagellar biosynthesis protein FliR
MPIYLLFSWLMVTLRALGVVLLLPTLGGQQLPVAMRVALSLGLATLLYGIVPHVYEVPNGLLGLMTAAGSEVILGLAMGFVGRLVFATVETAGRMINNEIGLGGIPGVDIPRPNIEPLAATMSAFSGVLFFMSGGHLAALGAFVRSFDFAAAGHAGFGPASAEAMIVGTGRVIELGFRIAAPFIALNFLVNLAFSVLGRAVPRTNVFVLSFSLRMLVGFTLLATSGTLIARYVWVEFDLLPGRMLDLLPLAH